MSFFIKPGYWNDSRKSIKGALNIDNHIVTEAQKAGIASQNERMHWGGSYQYAGRIYVHSSPTNYNDFSVNWTQVGATWDRSPILNSSRYGTNGGWVPAKNYTTLSYIFLINNYNTFTDLEDGDIFMGLARLTDDGYFIPILETERPIPALSWDAEKFAYLTGSVKMDISPGDRFTVYLYTGAKEVRDVRYTIDIIFS